MSRKRLPPTKVPVDAVNWADWGDAGEPVQTLLMGCLDESSKTWRRYPADEREGRRALANMLRDPSRPVPPGVRLALAALFDPDFDPERPARTLKFAFRSRRRQSTFARDVVISLFVAHAAKRPNMSVEGAVAEAAERFGLSEPRIWQIRKAMEPPA